MISKLVNLDELPGLGQGITGVGTDIFHFGTVVRVYSENEKFKGLFISDVAEKTRIKNKALNNPT